MIELFPTVPWDCSGTGWNCSHFPLGKWELYPSGTDPERLGKNDLSGS